MFDQEKTKFKFMKSKTINWISKKLIYKRRTSIISDCTSLEKLIVFFIKKNIFLQIFILMIEKILKKTKKLFFFILFLLF